MPKLKLTDPIKSKILEENKWLLGIEEISQVVKDHGKIKADKMVKAVYLAYDSQSPYRTTGMTMAKIKKDIINVTLVRPGFKWDDIEELGDFWVSDICTDSESPLFVLKKELDKFKEFFDNDKYEITLENAKDRAAALKSYTSLVKDYEEMKRKVMNEEKKEATKKFGGYQPSLTESYKDRIKN